MVQTITSMGRGRQLGISVDCADYAAFDGRKDAGYVREFDSVLTRAPEFTEPERD
jgi:hypothetical protein